jgi:hypothetical protein
MPIYGKPVNSPYEPKKYPDKEYPKYPDKDSKFQNKDPKFQNKENPDSNPYKKVANIMDGSKLVDLQVYQPPPPKSANPYAGKKPFMPVEPIALTTPYNPPQYQSYVNEMMKNFYTPFIYKDYNIQIGAPNADHEDAFRLFEDMAPPAEYFSSYNNLRERCNLAGYIKGNFVIRHEGENAFLANGPNSLNSRLNFIGVNPFDPDNVRNPYKNLGDGFLLYTSCYPILKDKKNDATMCNKSSVGVNIRVYCMSKSCYLSQYDDGDGFKSVLSGENNMVQNEITRFDKDDNKTFSNKFNYEPWRENYYYNFIRTTICGSNISPNFIQSYCYFQTMNPDMYFKYKNRTEKKDLALTAMTILTESPNYSLYMWGSNIQNVDRSTSTMTQLGYKPPILWTNIIEQMVISFYVMFKNKFAFREMDIKSNFFIKVINKNNNSPSFWKYNIKGINYYINNYGNLLLIDSSYKNLNEIKDDYLLLKYHDIHPSEQKQKENVGAILMESFYNDKYPYDRNRNSLSKNDYILNIYRVLFANMSEILQIDTFSKKANSRKDPNNAFVGVDLGDGINTYNQKMNEAQRIIGENKKYFSGSASDLINDAAKLEAKFDDLFSNLITNILVDKVHNRIGTYVRDNENQYISKENLTIVKKGDIILYEQQFETYVFVLFIEFAKTPTGEIDTNIYKCITKKNDELEIVNIPKDLTCSYLDVNDLKLDMKSGEPVPNEMDLIDDSFIIP